MIHTIPIKKSQLIKIKNISFSIIKWIIAGGLHTLIILGIIINFEEFSGFVMFMFGSIFTTIFWIIQLIIWFENKTLQFKPEQQNDTKVEQHE